MDNRTWSTIIHLSSFMRWEAVPFRNDLIFSYGFGSEHAQEGGRVHRPCADLSVVGLGDERSTVRCPEVL